MLMFKKSLVVSQCQALPSIRVKPSTLYVLSFNYKIAKIFIPESVHYCAPAAAFFGLPGSLELVGQRGTYTHSQVRKYCGPGSWHAQHCTYFPWYYLSLTHCSGSSVPGKTVPAGIRAGFSEPYICVTQPEPAQMIH